MEGTSRQGGGGNVALASRPHDPRRAPKDGEGNGHVVRAQRAAQVRELHRQKVVAFGVADPVQQRDAADRACAGRNRIEQRSAGRAELQPVAVIHDQPERRDVPAIALDRRVRLYGQAAVAAYPGQEIFLP